MMRRRVLGMLAGLVTMLALASCGSRKALRYKMTVEVDTPEGVRSGFAVREMRLSTDNIVRPTTGDIKGEAVAVDLPGGQVLFALLTGGDGDVDYAMQIGGRAEVWGKSLNEPRDGPVELYPTAPKTVGLARTNPLPMLVRFGDPRDPKSVEEVGPGTLQAMFGPGVKLRQIFIEATDEPVTVGIGERFPWFERYRAGRTRLSGSTSIAISTNELPDNLSTGSFAVGLGP